MSALLTLVLAAAGTQPAPPVFTVGVERIRVETLVSRRGRPVVGLTSGDFEVRDSGVPQQLEPLLREDVALDVVLVLDHSRSVFGRKLEELRAAAGAFLDGLRKGERAALVTFSDEVQMPAALTDDLASVRAALARGSPSGSTALRDAVYTGLHVLEPSGRRNAVVVFSDGIDNASWLTEPAAIEAGRRSESIVYAVVAREQGDLDEKFLPDLARTTGGRVFAARGAADLRSRFLSVLHDIRSRYVLSYVPQGVDQPGWHPLEVRLKRKKAEILARPGYWRPAAPTAP